MEYAQNTLSDLIQNEKFLIESRARSIYRQLVSVLSYCNSYGMVHHDINSKKILINAENILKISIFGYSYRSIDVYTNCKSDNIVQYDYADIFSSGVVLFEMLYGKLPVGYDQVSLKRFFRHVQFPDQPHVNMICKTLIQRILVQQSDERISWKDIVESDFILYI